MRVPTLADTPELERIVNEACEDAFADVAKDCKDSRFDKEAVNWANLCFRELETNPRVSVRKASPNATELRKFIWERLGAAGFDVEVVTEW